MRRAEEIKHLAASSGFPLHQIKSILLNVEGKEEKHAHVMPEKTCLLSVTCAIIQGHCISVKKTTEKVAGCRGSEGPSVRGSQC